MRVKQWRERPGADGYQGGGDGGCCVLMCVSEWCLVGKAEVIVQKGDNIYIYKLSIGV